MNEIALITDNPLFYYEAAKELKSRGMGFSTLEFSEEIPQFITVVLTSEQEKDRIDFQNVVSGKDARAVVNEAVKFIAGVNDSCGEIIIGIDPGLKPGIAVLTENRIVDIYHQNSPEDTLETVREIISTYNGRNVRIKVGTGGGVYRLRILRLLQENFDIQIEMVDESSTTPNTKGKKAEATKDIIAAINIALKQGRILKRKIEIIPKKGEIKNLQKKSRKLSGNITISKELAEDAARGKISLEEAVKRHKIQLSSDK